MINLLPPENIKDLKKLYRWHLAGAAGVMLALWFGVVALVSASLYLPVRQERLVAERGLAEQSAATIEQTLAESQAWVAELRGKAEALEAFTGGEAALPEWLGAILEAKPAGLRITKIAYRPGAESGALEVAGRAAGRKDLLAFLDTLSRHPFFAKVDSPVSNLIKDRDIDFSLTLKLK